MCYNPDVDNLLNLCHKLQDNNNSIFLIDNTEECYIKGFPARVSCTLISLGRNTGIALAQNVGIKEAIKRGAEVIVFFDQDSKIEDDFLSFLLASVTARSPQVYAPVYFDQAKGYEFPSMKLNRFGILTKVYKGNKVKPYDADVVISSGMAITKEAFDIVGLMDEDFFIDYVDTEWCLRCRSKNIPIKIIPDAIMKHSIGESSKNLGFIRIFTHSPVRSYYLIRNSFHFLKKKHVPLLLGLKEFSSLIVHQIILLLFLKNRGVYLKEYYRAINDGFRGIVGQRPV